MRIEGLQGGVTLPIQQNLGQGSQQVSRAIEVNSSSNGREFKKQDRRFTEEQLNKAIDKANDSFKPFDRKFERSVHEKTGTFMVKVIDTVTDEVIREIPPEKILDMVAHMLEVAGILVDVKG